MDAQNQAQSETKARILEAAHRVFLRRGTAGARTKDIAEEAGVNKALLHYYFSSKQKLAEAVFMRAAGTVLPVVLSTLASDLPLREKLQRVIDTQLDLMSANPYLPGYLIAEFQYRNQDLRGLVHEMMPIERQREVALEKLQQDLDREADADRLRRARAVDVMVSLMSQVVFPFAAAPVLDAVVGLGPEDRAAHTMRLRESLADSILRSLKP